MPSGIVPHGQQRANANNRHSDANQDDDNYERIIARLTNAPVIYLPARAHIDRRMTPALMRVFTSMCWHLNEDWVCWPGQDLLASELGITKQAVSKSIAQLIQLGYVEIVRRGFRGVGQTNVYRVIIQQNPENLAEKYGGNSPQSAGKTKNAEKSAAAPAQKNPHSQPHVDSIVNLTLTHSQPHVVQKYNQEDNQGRSSSEESNLSTSLAPLARTRERFDATAIRHDPLFIAVCAHLPEPVLPAEWRQWAAMLNQLHRGGVTAADIPTAVQGWRLRWDISKLTLPALVHHWAEIREGKTGEQVHQAIRNREHAAAERAAQQQRHEQRGEFQRLYNECLGLPADTPLPGGIHDESGA